MPMNDERVEEVTSSLNGCALISIYPLTLRGVSGKRTKTHSVGAVFIPRWAKVHRRFATFCPAVKRVVMFHGPSSTDLDGQGLDKMPISQTLGG